MGSEEGKYGMFSTYDEKQNKWRVSLRSNDKPVSPICEKFGGGGHSAACGVKVQKNQLTKIVEELKKL